MQDTTVKNILIFFAAVTMFYLLNLLSAIILPLVLAMLIAILVQPLINFLLKKGLPKWLILPTFSILSLAVLFVIGLIISNTIAQIVDEQNYLLSRLLLKLDNLLIWTNDTFNTKVDSTLLVSEIYKSFGEGGIPEALSGFASGLGSFFGSFLFFSLYYVMLLAGMANYEQYLSFVGGDQGVNLLKEYENIRHSIFSYMWIKVLISIFTGLLTFTICMAFSIKFAVFWGFLAFLLNFIPNIGSIIGTILPILMGIIQIDSITDIAILAILLIALQFIMGNIIEPIIMGNRLRINTLTVLFGLVFWGYIWGIPGMILSVPLLVIMKIILERSPGFSFFARLMGYPVKEKHT
ncbi:MAG: AI-2E family transporter [Candidatus Kapabacteria bacterium]|nr:AI-2E family transporter [Ignavibacteriota bacterium]MCW5884581.1 AI-2E family transporter [Candidatus Kapabacteria bacterium]